MSCEQMAAAASDPTAVRPGDDKTTCDQIAAEMKQPFTPPDQAKVTEAQVAATDFKTTAEREQKEVTARVARLFQLANEKRCKMRGN